MRKAALLCLVLLFCFCGRARAAQRNSKCQWPAETRRLLNLSDSAARTHLRQDAQLAEDLAIRYADAHDGPHSGQFESWAAYNNTCDSCMISLLATVAADDGVTEEQVRAAVTQRPLAFDLAITLSFAVFYFLVANAMAQRVWRRFPIQDGWITGVVAMAAVSIVVGAAGVFTGAIWAGIAESIRLGNGHLSYRLDRIPWRHHQVSLFIAAILLFWIAAAIQSRRLRAEPALSLVPPHSSAG
jgi:hypothetical protein